jgi:uncharacterized protein with von Willebrand factor type A (vWA) domain
VNVEMTEAAEIAVRIAQRLRAAGIAVSSAQTLDLVAAFGIVGFLPTATARTIARCVLAGGPSDFEPIDRAVDRALAEMAGVTLPASIGEQSASTSPAPAKASDDEQLRRSGIAETAASMDCTSTEAEVDGRGQRSPAVYSATESLQFKDFAAYTPSELEQAKRFLRSMRWRPPLRATGRRRSSRRGRELDPRRVLRDNLRRGGEIVAFPRRERVSKPRPLVVLCDISGSMDTYTRMLLHVVHALLSRCPSAEVFFFGTRLTRVTHLMSRRDPDAMLTQVGSQVTDWSGGTRIGESMGTFNRRWARRIAVHGSVTMIISDGWDRGDLAQLRQEMAYLHRLSHRLIWLNPLLGSSGYEPLTAGMRASLPFVDDFVAANNLASMESLSRLLDELQ